MITLIRLVLNVLTLVFLSNTIVIAHSNVKALWLNL